MSRAALLLFLSIACQSAGEVDTPPTGFDAKTQVDAWVELWNTYDLTRLEDLFLWDSTVTYLSSEREGLIRGPAALREHHVGMGFVDGGRPPEQELWVEDVRSSVYDATAVVSAVWLFGERSAATDSVQRGPMTIVYVRTAGGFRIAHMHFANY